MYVCNKSYIPDTTVDLLDFYATGNTLVCDWWLEYTDNITDHMQYEQAFLDLVVDFLVFLSYFWSDLPVWDDLSEGNF